MNKNDLLAQAQHEAAALVARCEALEKDAARYRWLRDTNGPKPIYIVENNFGGSLDAAIDGEIAAEPPLADGAEHE
jgi:hypothetical protein